MKSYEQLEQKITDNTFTKKDAANVYLFVRIGGLKALKSFGIIPESGENLDRSTTKIKHLLRGLLMGKTSN